MNIPYCVLKEQKGISSKCYNYHQNLTKTLYKSLKNQMKSNSYVFNNKNFIYSKQKIYKWLFNLDFSKRLKVCSIYNNWFSKILFQLLTYYNYDESIKFFPTKNHENYFAFFDENLFEENYDYKKFWQKIGENDFEKFELFFKGQKIENSSNKTQRGKNFIKELKFITIDEYNDTLTLSYELLNSREKLSEYFDHFSNCKIFEENIIPIRAKKGQNIFNFSLPSWIKGKNVLTIQELIVIAFEQIISIYYQIASFGNNFPENELFPKIDDLLNKNKNLENYLSDSSNEEAIKNIFNLNKISEDIYSKINKDLMNYYENISDRIYEIAFNRKMSMYFKDEDSKPREIYNSIEYLKNEYQKNIPEFVNTIFYIDSSIAFKTQNLVYNLVYQKIDQLFSEKNVVDLCADSPIDKTKKNRNKKNRRNKKTKKSKSKENNSNETSIINTNNNTVNENGNSFNNINACQLSDMNYLKTNNSINNNSDDDSNDNDVSDFVKCSFCNKTFQNKRGEYIELKILNEQGKEIKNEDTKVVKNENKNENKNEDKKEIKTEVKEDTKEEVQDENKNEVKEEGINHIMEELKEIDEEKKKKKKRKNRKNKKKKENKNGEKKEEKNGNINNNDNDIKNNEIKNEEVIKDNINIKIDEIKDKSKESLKEEEKKDNEMLNEQRNENNNNTFISEDIKNIKKKHKEFFLFPIEHNKKKKEKKTKIKQGENNSSKKNNTKPESENEYDEKSTASLSHSTEKIFERNESNENCNNNNNNMNINDINKYINNKNKNDILIETKESKIEFTFKKSMDKESENENKIKENKFDDEIDDKNKMECLSKFDKYQISYSNNPVINNYIILGKDSFQNNTPYIKNFEQKINNNIFIQTQNPMFSPNFYTPSPLTTFNYPPPYQYQQNYYMNEQNESFIELSNEIIQYEKNVDNNLEILKKYREQILNKIKDYIQEIMEENNFLCKLINYGSYETKLNIEISDIDILIKFCKKNSNNINFENQSQVLSLIYNKLNEKKEDFSILSINAIYTASVPVLKIKCNLEDMIPSQKINEIKNNYGLNIKEEILQLNFDFTFTEVNNLNEAITIPCLEIVSYIKKIMNNYKEIKPLILLLKRYMKINELNKIYTGGLSSYSLFLLVYAYVKSLIFPWNNLGQYLFGFFECYSNLNFGIFSINVNLNNPFIQLNELHEYGMMLIDPITNLNVAKSTFKVDQIKSVLTKGVVNIRNVIIQKFVESNKNYNNNIINVKKTLFLEELFKNRNRVPIINLIDPM